MTASLGFLSTLVGIAVLITAISPLILIIIFIRDWKGKKLW